MGVCVCHGEERWIVLSKKKKGLYCFNHKTKYGFIVDNIEDNNKKTFFMSFT